MCYAAYELANGISVTRGLTCDGDAERLYAEAELERLRVTKGRQPHAKLIGVCVCAVALTRIVQSP